MVEIFQFEAITDLYFVRFARSFAYNQPSIFRKSHSTITVKNIQMKIISIRFTIYISLYMSHELIEFNWKIYIFDEYSEFVNHLCKYVNIFCWICCRFANFRYDKHIVWLFGVFGYTFASLYTYIYIYNCIQLCVSWAVVVFVGLSSAGISIRQYRIYVWIEIRQRHTPLADVLPRLNDNPAVC